MKIANIIYEDELVNHTEVDYINYHKECKKYEDLDKSLPTLYVGWSFMKGCNPDNEIIQNADILKKKIVTNELYWEFSFQESKSSHVKGLQTFTNLAPQFYFSPKYKYTNLDPVFFQLANIQDTLDVIPKKIDSVYQYKQDMLYLLCDNKIIGLNLKTYGYFEFKIEELKNNIFSRTNNVAIDADGTAYLKYYKKFPNFAHLRRYIIVILTK